jgi:hypothetical protein
MEYKDVKEGKLKGIMYITVDAKKIGFPFMPGISTRWRFFFEQ